MTFHARPCPDRRPARPPRPSRAWPWLAAALLVAVPAGAQEVSFTAVTAARDCLALLPAGGKVYGGLADGGVVAWDAADPAAYEHWTVADGLSSQRVTALAASDRFLWVATSGAGLTRVALDTAEPVFRQFANIGGYDVTAVVAATRGTGEVVYYGLDEGGVGVINSGLPGHVYTRDENRLVSDVVQALALHGGDLWVGTEEGVSRFRNNVFTTLSAGLPDPNVVTLAAAGDTLLLAGTASGGAARWDEDTQAWARLGTLGGRVLALAVRDDGVWMLRQVSGQPSLHRWDGAAWQDVALAEAGTHAIAAAGGTLWAAGTRVEPDMDPQGRAARAFLARRAGPAWETWRTDELAYLGVDGVAFGPAGAAWLGSREGVGVARLAADGALAQVLRLGTADNDSSGLLHFGARILSLVGAPAGDLWFAQFEKGLVRLRPGADAGLADATFLSVTAANSPLSNNRIVRIVRHPDGPLLFCSDTGGVDVLADPERPRDPAAWLRLPTGTPGLAGAIVREVAFASRDVAWFAVERVGLVRWDVNGAADAEAALTWTDTADDDWGAPVGTVTGLDASALQFVRGLASGADGLLWTGGAGGVALLRDNGGALSLVASWEGKTDVFADGLLTSSVLDLELDDNGDCWVALDAGLNRIRRRGDTTTIDAYTDLASYDAYAFGSLYGPGILAPLPGGSVRELASDPASRRLVAGTDFGAALFEVAPLVSNGADALAGLYLYPNPLESAAGLRLGGLELEVTQSGSRLEGGATVEIYNLEGQLVYRATHVADNESFWEGRTLSDLPAAGGLYVVKVSLDDGRTAVRTLAVAR